METNTVDIWNYSLCIIRYSGEADDQVCIILLYFCWVVRVHLHVESTKSLDNTYLRMQYW